MLHWHELALVVIADREREIRNRRPRPLGLASGRRHPAAPETSPVDDARAAAMDAQAARGRVRPPRPAFGR